MMLLDTHIWIWWIQGDARMKECSAILDAAAPGEIAVSAISCWEVAKLHALRRLAFDCSLDEWFDAAIDQAKVETVDLTPAIAIESERLPGSIHRDPADRMLIASSRVLDCTLLTEDLEILKYPHVRAKNLMALINRGLQ